MVGDRVSNIDGALEGHIVGNGVGEPVDAMEGRQVGDELDDGRVVGIRVGNNIGTLEGRMVGDGVGTTVGVAEG